MDSFLEQVVASRMTASRAKPHGQKRHLDIDVGAARGRPPRAPLDAQASMASLARLTHELLGAA